MFCPKCGKEIVDDAVVCVHCGREIKENTVANQNKENNKPKTGMGVLMALLLGLIGLVIGIVMYPSGTVARDTFMKGWIIAFAIDVVVAIILYFAVFAVMFQY